MRLVRITWLVDIVDLPGLCSDRFDQNSICVLVRFK